MIDFDEDYGDEFEGFQNCPHCHREYDEIDHEYQICSKCGYDAESREFSPNNARTPNQRDYMAGDADILTGQWI